MGPTLISRLPQPVTQAASILAQSAKVLVTALVLIGAADRMTPPKAGRALAEALPDPRTMEMPGAGHMMMIEKPDATLDMLKGFLAGVRPA